ncbi:GntR family transcriptional regulator [Virgibacillus sp. Bac330]|uniref:GntR family transcriptional regulator n=1 Tax=Virgibacillus sp. Bac330 TaxID=2419841 RepID=UPI000EF4E9AC|nr:GntR family transcriptional regulator [Virgibacillus sp. Bac330]
MQILISNSSKEPIYQQIKHQVKEKIVSSELREGDALPSMRQLAKDLHISVITTKRAYEELEKEGFIYSITGKGSFIAEQNPDIIKEKKLATIEDKLVEVIANSKELGLSLKDIKEWLTILYEER